MMTRTPRRPRAAALPAAFLLALAAAGPAGAAPPWLERLGSYRVLDASGRIAPNTGPTRFGRVAMRPAGPPPLLFRARPMFLSGYAGASYAPARAGGPYNTTGHVHPHGAVGGH